MEQPGVMVTVRGAMSNVWLQVQFFKNTTLVIFLLRLWHCLHLRLRQWMGCFNWLYLSRQQLPLRWENFLLYSPITIRVFEISNVFGLEDSFYDFVRKGRGISPIHNNSLGNFRKAVKRGASLKFVINKFSKNFVNKGGWYSSLSWVD